MITRRKQLGMSVIELLIALGLGLLVVSGVVQLFVGNSRTSEIVTAQARLQENARFAFDFISRSARSAGFLGCAPQLNNTARHLTGNWNLIPEYNITEPVDGWDSNNDGTYTPDNLTTLPRTTSGANINVHIAGNGIDRDTLADVADILVFRAVERPVARLAQTLQPDGNPVVATPGGNPAFAVEDVVFVSNCEQGALFKVTGVGVAGDETTLQRASAATGLPFDNSPTVTTATGDVIPETLSVLGRSYGVDATISRMQSDFYFVAESADNNRGGDTVFALWVKSGSAAPVELVQGVEDMQVLYGVDTSDDDVLNINQYREIQNVVDVTEIVAVRVTLIINSVDELAEIGDQLRRTFSKTIFVRNVG